MGLFDTFKKKSEDTGPAGTVRGTSTAQLVKVSDFLGEKNIVFFPAGPSKQQVLGSLIGSFDLPDPSAALKAILAREEAGTTVIATGLALPHARIPGIGRIVAALGLSPMGVLDPAAGDAAIHIFLLFLGPAENMRLHLAFLAAASALFQQEKLDESLLQLTTAKAVLDKIREAEKNFK